MEKFKPTETHPSMPLLQVLLAHITGFRTISFKHQQKIIDLGVSLTELQQTLKGKPNSV